jgi:hypothetical protein
MDFKLFFGNDVSKYAGIAEIWVKKYFQSVGYKMGYTFVQDFAIADWDGGTKDVNETYGRVKKEWIDNYKAFTEAVMSINMLAWFYDQLIKQGVEREDISCEEIMDFYSELYYKAREDFYNKYENDEEACHYFFETTD